MPEISHRTMPVDGLDLHLAEPGPPDGPTVLLLHGFPECWYSWSHQLAALAEEGFHVVAPFDALVTTLRRQVPDLRGALLLACCGQWTQQERPTEINTLIADFARWTDRA